MDELVKAEFDRFDDRAKVQDHRIEDLEDTVKQIQDLSISIKELAINMKNMLEEQKKQGERLSKLEQEPADRWNNMMKTIFNTFLGALIGGIIAYVFR